MGEHGRFEQIISQFLLKSLHVILDSRVPSIRPHSRSGELGSNASVKKSDKWFSLVLGDRPAALDNLNFWHRNLMEPMIIDIILVQEVSDSSSTLGFGKYNETVIERWVVQYEHVKAVFPQYSDSSAFYKKTYKKSIILLRALHTMMRLLPAYRIYRKLCASSSQACDLEINYKVSSFSSPLSRDEEEMMKQYHFTSVEAPQGRLSISVTYRETLSNFNLDISTSFPPQIITDYVGSPATDPFRAFPSSVKGVSSTNSPSSTPFQRPHSWTSGIYRASTPIHRTSTVPTHQRTPSLDEFQLSPPFSPSPSPSPSPPTYLSGGKHIQTRMHSETAPVSIPHHPMMSRSPRYISPNLSDPNRHSLPPMSPRSSRLDPSSHDSPTGIRVPRKSDSSRAGESSNKILRDSKDDSGRFSALLSSSGSPRVGFSRSSSRLSFQDDLDDFDFSCPFIVDDVDPSDSLTSHNIDGKRGSESSSQASSIARKSQDAAVGALVHMFRTAPPLRQDSSCYSSRSLKPDDDIDGGESGGGDASSSGFFITRKTSDAMEELRSYKDMKDLLLSKSGTKIFSKEES